MLKRSITEKAYRVLCTRSLSSVAAAVTVSQPASTTTVIHSSLSSSSLIDYARGWAWQQTLLSRRLERRRQQRPHDDGDVAQNDADCVLVLEHEPVYTLGRGANEDHLVFLENASPEIKQKLSRSSRGVGSARLAVDKHSKDMLQRPTEEAVNALADIASPVMSPNGCPIYRIERGGEVTHHGPGQLVVYPLLDLKRPPYKQDLHWYLRMVEQVIIETLYHYDVQAERDEDNTGVWVGDDKIAAVGVSSSRWITTHGFAINVDCDLEYFDTSHILPCGIEGKGVTSLAKVLSTKRGESPTMREVEAVVLDKMKQVFDIANMEHGENLS